MPIYGQIQSFGVTNVLVVSVRYFGGVKLGVGGLISAYKESARLSLEAASIIEKTVDVNFRVHFDYGNINKVMRVVKERNILVTSQEMKLKCSLDLSVRKGRAEEIAEVFNSIFQVRIEEI